MAGRLNDACATREEVESWFDGDGRLINEAAVRRTLFEVGVEPSCRRKLWKFIFGVYPCDSTRREQKAWDLEHRARYRALKERWEVLDWAVGMERGVVSRRQPFYMDLSDGEDHTHCSDRHRHTSPVKKVQKGELLIVPRGVASTKLPPTWAVSPIHTPHTPCDEASRCLANSIGNEQSCSLCEFGGSLFSRNDSVISNDDDHDGNTESVWDASVERGCGAGHEEGDGIERRPLANSGPRQWCCDMVSGVGSDNELDDEEGRTVLQILEFPSRISATKERVDLENAYLMAKKIILTDVVRTDRNSHFFTHKRNLRKVHRILMIYAMFHPGIGYAQGMNDILVHFLVVMRSEVDAYWMFSKYMEHKIRDFVEENYMLGRFAAIKMLLEEFDNEVSEFFRTSECHELLFCDRWLLVDFKREFEINDSIRLFEILSCHYLDKKDKGSDVSVDPKRGDLSVDPQVKCGFELFICAAILVVYKKDVCVRKDAASVYGAVNGLAMTMDLKAVLLQATEMYLCHYGNRQ